MLPQKIDDGPINVAPSKQNYIKLWVTHELINMNYTQCINYMYQETQLKQFKSMVNNVIYHVHTIIMVYYKLWM
jgi:hypothetical protein